MGYRNYAPANGFLVAKNGTGDFTTIGAALTAATSGKTIYISSGTYTENPALVAGVNLVAFEPDALTPNVIINGECTFSSAGTVSISGIALQTNSNYCLSVTGSAASIVNLVDCYINASNNTAINYSSSSSSSAINLYSCDGNLGTTGIAYFSASGAGTVIVFEGDYDNSGASTTASTVSGGSLALNFCSFANPITTSSTAGFDAAWSTIVGNNTTALTHGSTTNATLYHCVIVSGTASAISISASCTLFVDFLNCSSGNTDAITGSGTLKYGLIAFDGTSATINTTTQTPLITFPPLPGALTQWTPVVTFGGASTGITYSAQNGYYYTQGKAVFFNFELIFTSVGSATGQAILTMPVSTGSSGSVNAIMIPFWSGMTLGSGYTTMNLQGGASSTGFAFQEMGSGKAAANLSNTAFSSSSTLVCSGMYFTN